MNEFVVNNGFISKTDSSVQGTLTATTYFSGGTNLNNIFATTATTSNLQAQITAISSQPGNALYLFYNY